MAKSELKALARLIGEQEAQIASDWVKRHERVSHAGSGSVSSQELLTQAKAFLALLRQALPSGSDAATSDYDKAREFLRDVSRSRAMQGFTPSETAGFVLSLKQPLFDAMRAADSSAGDSFWPMNQLLDDLGIFTTDVFLKSREEIILRQQREIAELSTPVVKLWEGILALPLIGTLDSERTQVVMENLLENIVSQSADIAIIDITGVPTVDTLVAQHLLKTVAAARLMGADCLISGIRPQIAQTMVHLGVELNVISKATLADAFAIALHRRGRMVVKNPSQARA